MGLQLKFRVGLARGEDQPNGLLRRLPRGAGNAVADHDGNRPTMDAQLTVRVDCALRGQIEVEGCWTWLTAWVDEDEVRTSAHGLGRTAVTNRIDVGREVNARRMQQSPSDASKIPHAGSRLERASSTPKTPCHQPVASTHRRWAEEAIQRRDLMSAVVGVSPAVHHDRGESERVQAADERARTELRRRPLPLPRSTADAAGAPPQCLRVEIPLFDEIVSRHLRNGAVLREVDDGELEHHGVAREAVFEAGDESAVGAPRGLSRFRNQRRRCLIEDSEHHDHAEGHGNRESGERAGSGASDRHAHSIEQSGEYHEAGEGDDDPA